jgi:hypothetical protein
MTERATRLETWFSTVDAEYPSFSLRDGTLVLEFIDSGEQAISAEFANCAGVRWQEADSPGPQERGEQALEIVESEWVREYYGARARTVEERVRHFRLCFSESGVLEVLATSLGPRGAG